MYEIFEKLLKEKGLTAYKVGKGTGISTATLTSWKQGKYTPKQDKLQKIADYLGVSIELFSGTSDSPEKKRMTNLINSFGNDALKIISEICKKRRIYLDLTEKTVSNSLEIDLADYLFFESNSRDIGIDNILKLLSFFDLSSDFITGLVTATVITSNSKNDLLNKLNFPKSDEKVADSILKDNDRYFEKEIELENLSNDIGEMIKILDIKEGEV